MFFVRVPTLLRFAEFAQSAEACKWEELPAHVEPFVEDWLTRDDRQYSQPQRKAAARGIRNPIQQLLRLILPHHAENQILTVFIFGPRGRTG